MPARKPSQKAKSARSKPARKAPIGKPATSAKPAAASQGNQGPEIPMRTVTGQLVVSPAAKALDWYAKVFGGKELARMPGPNGLIMHSMMQVGDTVFMVSDPFGAASPKELTGAFLHIHDKGIQAMWDRALANGATVNMPLAVQFWGDKYGQLRDPFGQLWSLGWPANLSPTEKKRLEAEAMKHLAAA